MSIISQESIRDLYHKLQHTKGQTSEGQLELNVCVSIILSKVFYWRVLDLKTRSIWKWLQTWIAGKVLLIIMIYRIDVTMMMMMINIQRVFIMCPVLC